MNGFNFVKDNKMRFDVSDIVSIISA